MRAESSPRRASATPVPGRIAQPVVFWMGIAIISAGVMMYLIDYAYALEMGIGRLSVDTMGPLGILGIGVDIAGTITAIIGLLPRGLLARREARATVDASTAPSDAEPFTASGSTAAADHSGFAAMDSTRMTSTHWKMLSRLFLGLVLDTMKPALLGFVIPGIRAEYGLTPALVSLYPLSALIGLMVGSVLFGWLGDIIGRRASFIMTAMLLGSTAVCGFMPGFGFHLAACFIMGLAAGGELPVIYTLLAETMPAKHRAWMTVVLGGLGSLCGFLVASLAAAALEPTFTWRALWLTNLPTALMALGLIAWVPESPRFLMQMGAHGEARKVLASMGVVLDRASHGFGHGQGARGDIRGVVRGRLRGTTAMLCFFGFSWGLCNWGFITWLPSMIRDLGIDAGAVSRLLAVSAFLAMPGTLVAAALCALWSTKKTAVIFGLSTSLFLALFGFGAPAMADRIDLVSALVVGLLISSSSMIGLLAPYSVELYPTALRGVGSGVVAASSKSGGLVGPTLVGTILTLVPGMTWPALAISAPIAAASLVLALRAPETRGKRLVELSALPALAAADRLAG